MSACSSEECEVCGGQESTPSNPLVLCGNRLCLRGLHLLCFAPPQPVLSNLKELVYFCPAHLPPEPSPRIANRARQAAAVQPKVTALVHNLPPPLAAGVATSSAAGGNSVQQISLEAARKDEALRFNSSQLGVKVALSTIALAGPGLFATRAFKVGETIGYFFGLIVPEPMFQRAVNDELDEGQKSTLTFAQENFYEPASKGNWRSIIITELATAEHEFCLLASDQCPPAFANDPRDTARVNAALCMGMLPEVLSKGSGVLGWNSLPLKCIAAIPLGAEIFIDYGWSEGQWSHAVRLMRRADKFAASAARYDNIKTEHIYAWADDCVGFDDCVEPGDRAGLIAWLVNNKVPCPLNPEEARQHWEQAQQPLDAALEDHGHAASEPNGARSSPSMDSGGANSPPLGSGSPSSSLTANSDRMSIARLQSSWSIRHTTQLPFQSIKNLWHFDGLRTATETHARSRSAEPASADLDDLVQRFLSWDEALYATLEYIVVEQHIRKEWSFDLIGPNTAVICEHWKAEQALFQFATGHDIQLPAVLGLTRAPPTEVQGARLRAHSILTGGCWFVEEAPNHPQHLAVLKESAHRRRQESAADLAGLSAELLAAESKADSLRQVAISAWTRLGTVPSVPSISTGGSWTPLDPGGSGARSANVLRPPSLNLSRAAAVGERRSAAVALLDADDEHAARTTNCKRVRGYVCPPSPVLQEAKPTGCIPTALGPAVVPPAPRLVNVELNPGDSRAETLSFLEHGGVHPLSSEQVVFDYFWTTKKRMELEYCVNLQSAAAALAQLEEEKLAFEEYLTFDPDSPLVTGSVPQQPLMYAIWLRGFGRYPVGHSSGFGGQWWIRSDDTAECRPAQPQEERGALFKLDGLHWIFRMWHRHFHGRSLGHPVGPAPLEPLPLHSDDAAAAARACDRSGAQLFFCEEQWCGLGVFLCIQLHSAEAAQAQYRQECHAFAAFLRVNRFDVSTEALRLRPFAVEADAKGVHWFQRESATQWRLITNLPSASAGVFDMRMRFHRWHRWCNGRSVDWPVCPAPDKRLAAFEHEVQSEIAKAISQQATAGAALDVACVRAMGPKLAELYLSESAEVPHHEPSVVLASKELAISQTHEELAAFWKFLAVDWNSSSTRALSLRPISFADITFRRRVFADESDKHEPVSFGGMLIRADVLAKKPVEYSNDAWLEDQLVLSLIRFRRFHRACWGRPLEHPVGPPLPPYPALPSCELRAHQLDINMATFFFSQEEQSPAYSLYNQCVPLHSDEAAAEQLAQELQDFKHYFSAVPDDTSNAALPLRQFGASASDGRFWRRGESSVEHGVTVTWDEMEELLSRFRRWHRWCHERSSGHPVGPPSSYSTSATIIECDDASSEAADTSTDNVQSDASTEVIDAAVRVSSLCNRRDPLVGIELNPGPGELGKRKEPSSKEVDDETNPLSHGAAKCPRLEQPVILILSSTSAGSSSSSSSVGADAIAAAAAVAVPNQAALAAPAVLPLPPTEPTATNCAQQARTSSVSSVLTVPPLNQMNFDARRTYSASELPMVRASSVVSAPSRWLLTVGMTFGSAQGATAGAAAAAGEQGQHFQLDERLLQLRSVTGASIVSVSSEQLEQHVGTDQHIQSDFNNAAVRKIVSRNDGIPDFHFRFILLDYLRNDDDGGFCAARCHDTCALFLRGMLPGLVACGLMNSNTELIIPYDAELVSEFRDRSFRRPGGNAASPFVTCFLSFTGIPVSDSPLYQATTKLASWKDDSIAAVSVLQLCQSSHFPFIRIGLTDIADPTQRISVGPAVEHPLDSALVHGTLDSVCPPSVMISKTAQRRGRRRAPANWKAVVRFEGPATGGFKKSVPTRTDSWCTSDSSEVQEEQGAMPALWAPSMLNYPCRHLFLRQPSTSPWMALPSLYCVGPPSAGLDDGFRLEVDVARSVIGQPIQFRVVATRIFLKREHVCWYGGLPVHNAEFTRHGLPTTHAREIPSSDYVLDGLPLAQMLRRPVPRTQQELNDFAEPDRMPTYLPDHPSNRPSWSPIELQLWRETPHGYMLNTATKPLQHNNVGVAYQSFAARTCEIPRLFAARDILPGDELLCRYGRSGV